ncbi:MAG: hypothetical protein NC913_06605 [Candidatus Omnitrophica bacterium]|nr:hypothetical protein [Candidatus Omnitrophota bacterium]
MKRKKHIFLDLDTLSDWDTSIVQRFQKAEKIQINAPKTDNSEWDARCSEYPTVLYENGIYRMWYSVQPSAKDYSENPDHFYSAYAESTDGINWRKPDLKITAQHIWPGNNLLALPGAIQGVVKGLPGSKYKYYAIVIQISKPEPGITDKCGAIDERGTILFGSNDGFQWQRIKKIVAHGDCGCIFTDFPSQRYLFFQKVGLMHNLFARRSFIGLESKDYENWIGYDGALKWNECFVADDYDDMIARQRGFLITDFYGITLHRVGDVYIAVQNVFCIGLPLRNNFGQNPSGFSHFRLAYSHNGFNWRYPAGRPAILELGEPGDFDSGFMCPGLNLLEKDNDVLLYYSGTPFMHGWCIDVNFSFRKDISLREQDNSYFIGLAKMKKDRYASLYATYKGRFSMDPDSSGIEALTVNPEKPELYVNVYCPKGYTKVAIMDYKTKKPLPGFDFDDCIPVTGDFIRAPIVFRKKKISDIPADKLVYLSFELYRGEIFSFEWGL